MKQGLLQWSPCNHLRPSLSSSFLLRSPIRIARVARRPPPPPPPAAAAVSAALEPPAGAEALTARERRQLRNQRRESRAAYNWREEVEERLIKKPKKRYASWTEELNLDTLAEPGPQWWIVRVSRVRGQETADLIARSLIRNFPEVDFKVYAPAVQEKRKLKNGSYSVKARPLFPGCVFLRCILNKELHDFIRECDGVGGFVGSKVGNTKRQINKPRPVSEDDMEAIFRKAKEEQEKTDRAFEEEQVSEKLKSEKLDLDLHSSTDDSLESALKPKRKSRKSSSTVGGLSAKEKYKLLVPGSTVRVLSGTFAGFEGSLKKLNRKNKKATIGFALFGKESLVDLDVDEIVPEVA
ncbi:hypothetical protein EUGRSUZ_K03006 [Eucalyptus grandis]|uniref:NusG-like N-terminal domain-containing protein n=4 Tax=Eucalyptus grandis TaxID=71139 RepID=A0A059A760_EUCGR|nr:hypothetical protein EUGRSUZ_K03006 [Eucalyptus grandis]KAK3406882.1 hypothetical protein EUGRSUZ_K03006 [Eucalyptus grandis]KAK3406883.1 hypothetical protein EUGRSUZ_K03006 [Eucalyptus grandis]